MATQSLKRPSSGRLFLDTASISDIEKFAKWGIIEGVTTNQGLFLREGGIDFKERVLDICKIIDGPVSVETTEHGVERLIREAEEYAHWSENIAIKVAMSGSGDGLEVVYRLHKKGIMTNMTVMMNFGQLLLAANAGATFVSLFFNRVRDYNNMATKHNLRTDIEEKKPVEDDPVITIEKYVSFAGDSDTARLIVGSIRKSEDVSDSVAAGAHIVTVTPKILREMPFHEKTEETIREFDDAWEKFKSSGGKVGTLR